MKAWLASRARRRTLPVIASLALLLVAIGVEATAEAQSQGPNYPSVVVNEQPSPSSPFPWVFPENARVSDDMIAAFDGAAASQYLKATDYSFALPNGAVITGIQVTVEGNYFPLGFGTEGYTVAARIVKSGSVGTADRSSAGSLPEGTLPVSPPFDGTITYGGNGDLWGETWTPSDINGAGFGFAFRVYSNAAPAVVDSISITVFYVTTSCGDSQIDPNEQCDDGNTANGDCCSSTCQFEAAGTSCADATVCNGAETCDGAGNCAAGTALDCDDGNLCSQDSCDPLLGCLHANEPRVGCRTALKSTLILKNKPTDAKDTLVWKWTKGQPTDPADFGVPTGTTQSTLCIYAGGTQAMVARYDVPGDAMKWSPVTTGFKYRDPAGSADGVTKVVLKGRTDSASKCLVKGKGAGLPDFDLTMLLDPVIVQLVNDSTSVCFQSTFMQADFVKFNDTAQFKAKTQ